MKKTAEFYPSNRYQYDFGLCSHRNGFAQIDTAQDAEYYGNWINPTQRILFTYMEGECITMEFDTDDEMKSEILELSAWHNDDGGKFKIDGMCNDEIINKFTDIGLSHLLH